MTIFHTDFTEYPTGVQPADWTPIWVTADVTYTVETGLDDQVLQAVCSAAAYTRGIIWNDIGSVTNVEVLAKLRPISSTAAAYETGIIVRASGTGTGYPVGTSQGFSVLVNTTFNRLALNYYANGYEQTFTYLTGKTLDLGTTYWLRVMIYGSYIWAKIWADGGAEPDPWDITNYNIGFAAYAGGVGLAISEGSSQCDEITIETNPARFLGTDSLNIWTDSVGTNFLTPQLTDSLNGWADKVDATPIQLRFTESLRPPYFYIDSIERAITYPVTGGGTTPVIAFAAPSSQTTQNIVYEGIIAPDTSITWYLRMDTTTGDADIPHPVRVVNDGALSNAILLHDSSNGFVGDQSTLLYMFRYYNGYSEHNLGKHGSDPDWEEFDLHTNGLSVVQEVSSHVSGDTLQVSTDFGNVWSAPIKIDYLDTLLGADYDTLVQAYDNTAHSVCVDEDTGIFYLLTKYDTTLARDEFAFVLLKSTNGTNWTHIKTWTDTYATPKYIYYECSLSVSSGHIYIVFMADGNLSFYVEHSSDSGVTWVETNVPGNVNMSMASIMGHNDTVMLVIPNYPNDNQITVLRSADSGSTWAQVLFVDDVAGDSYTGYQSARSSHDIFAFTECNIQYPASDVGGSWTDANGVHSMDGSGEDPKLCFWYTVDDGLTWILGISPASATDNYWQQSIDIFAIEDFTPIPPTPGLLPYNYNTLVYATGLMEGRSGWFQDKYTPDALIHYGEEGENVHAILLGGEDGGVYQLVGPNDNGVAISCNIRTKSKDQGDLRYNKLYGDVMLDCITNGTDVTATPGFNNHLITTAPITVNTATRTQVPVTIGTEWQTAKNISLDLSWNHNSLSPELFYIWEPRYTEEGGKLSAFSWDTSYITHGIDGYFFHGYLYLVHISTSDLTFSIFNEGGLTVASVSILNSGGVHNKTFVRLPVVKGKAFRYRLSSAGEFKVEGQESELLIKQWGSAAPWHHARIFQDEPRGEAA